LANAASFGPMSGSPDHQPEQCFKLRPHVVEGALEEKLEGVREVDVQGGEQLLVEGQGVQLVDSQGRAGFLQPMRKSSWVRVDF